MRMVYRGGLIAAGILMMLLASAVVWAGEYARPELLISTEELARVTNQPNVRIIDAVDPASYRRAHIPGAVNLFYRDVAMIESRKKNGYPVSEDVAGRIFGEAGIDKKKLVVVYGTDIAVFIQYCHFKNN